MRDDLKPIPDLINYFASSNGEIWRRLKTGSFKQVKPYRVKHHKLPANKWYLGVGITTENKKRTSRYVHSLVLSAFKGSRPDGMVCRHLDGNSINNNIDNLSWGTYLENSEDAKKHGTQTKNISYDTIDKIIVLRNEGKFIREIAHEINISEASVLRLLKKFDNRVKPIIDPKSRQEQYNHGDKCHTAKLDWEKVTKIRQRIDKGESLGTIAKDYNVSKMQVSNIKRNISWKVNPSYLLNGESHVECPR